MGIKTSFFVEKNLAVRVYSAKKNLREQDPTKIPRPNFIRIRNSADIRSDKSKPECGPFLRFKHSFDKSSKGSFVKRKIFVKKILSCTKMHFSVEEHINTIEQNVFLNFFNGFLCKSNLLFLNISHSCLTISLDLLYRKFVLFPFLKVLGLNTS